MDRLLVCARPRRFRAAAGGGPAAGPPRVWGALAAALLAAASPLFPAAAADAASPRVHFDVANRIGCRDLTTPEFAEANPDERLLEARFQVSSLIRSGSESDLIQYLYFLESPGKSLRIVDFLPQTTLASEIAGNVGVEKKEEKLRHFGLTVSGQYDATLKASGGGDVDSKSNSSVRYELLPPMELLAASGTVRRGSGVYFKLKTSPQTSLEGAKEFSLVLRAPANWRGDYVHLRCTAIGLQRGVIRPLDERALWGAGAFVIALYAEGDEAAKSAAQRLVQAESDLRRLAAQHREEIIRRSYPTLAHKVGALLDVVAPQIPDSWLEQLIYGPADRQASQFAQRLPSDVRQAAQEYLEARRSVEQLSGRDAQLARADAE